MLQPASIRVRDRGLRCALHYCASSGAGASQAARAACADRVLMAAPALADARDGDGLTPLHLAVVHGNVPLVQTLLAAGADVNARDDEHHTVVHWATGEFTKCFSIFVCFNVLSSFHFFDLGTDSRSFLTSVPWDPLSYGVIWRCQIF